MTESEYNKALDAIEAQIARDYLRQAERISGSASLEQITAMIRAGDALRVVRALTGGTYSDMLETVRRAYIKGGVDEIASIGRRSMPDGVTPEFIVRQPSALADLDAISTRVLTMIRQDQAEAVEAVIQASVARGDSAQRVAKNLIGTPGAYGQPRSGGVIGLTGQDATWIENARDQLSSGDAERMREYFGRVLRDRRYDGIVERAIEQGRAVAPADVDKIIKRYSERLLKNRAEVVSSIESLESYAAGRAQVYQQFIDEGVDPLRIQKRWKTRGDGKVRQSHALTNGQIRRYNQPFLTGHGASMMHPGDRSMGAGLSEIARCRCRDIYSIAENPIYG